MTVATDLSREARAFLDALAVGESGGSDDPYHVLYGGGHFDETTPVLADHYGFPDWPGKDNSHAAGRYQFEPATWREIAASFYPDVPDFRLPIWQDRCAWRLACRNYGARTKRVLSADLATRPGYIPLVLKSTWTSLNEQFPTRYAAALVALGGVTPISTTEDSIEISPSYIPTVQKLQHALNLAGASLKEDGDWGPLSQEALVKYYKLQEA